MTKLRTKTAVLIFIWAIALSLNPNASADEYIVLDGFGGVFHHSMRPEACRLAEQGHRVIYRPWWKWRNAIRAVDGPVNIIGFSMGGSRAVFASRHLNVRQIELLDPYVLRRRSIYLPQNVPAVVYRPICHSLIQTGPTIGAHIEVPIRTIHTGLPERFRQPTAWP